jgi:NAD(P)-dependent dehydrogenase (short-subunit alcohol dehydrogenase family)
VQRDDSRVAVVTGANRGIGLEVVRQLAARGDAVVLGARDLDGGRRAAEGLRGPGGGGADLPDGVPSGGFYRDGDPVPF